MEGRSVGAPGAWLLPAVPGRRLERGGLAVTRTLDKRPKGVGTVTITIYEYILVTQMRHDHWKRVRVPCGRSTPGG